MRPRFVSLAAGVEYDTAAERVFISPRRYAADCNLKAGDAGYPSTILAVLRMLQKDCPNLRIREYTIMGDHS